MKCQRQHGLVPRRSVLLLALWAIAALADTPSSQAPSIPTGAGAYRLATERLGPGTITLLPRSGGPSVLHPTIQSAVDAAGEGDTVLLSDGLFFGQGNRDILVEGKNLTIRSENGPERCVIDCTWRGRGFNFTGLATTSATLLTGVTIVRGNAIDNPLTEFGGGIAVRLGSSAAIDHCVVMACRAGNAGGISYFAPPDALGLIRNCVVRNNFSNSVGGGMVVSNTVVERCTVTENHARILAGGISAADQGVIRDCLVANNSLGPTSSRGGGILLFDSDVSVEGCTIANNTGASTGGGLGLQFGEIATVSNCIIWGNTASSSGSQVYLDTASILTLDHCTIEGGMDGMGTAALAMPVLIELDEEDPEFVDALGGDFRLSPGSMSIDSGNPLFIPVPNHGDLDNFPRIGNNVVDRGCYESWPGLALSLVSPGRTGEVNTIRTRGARPGTPTAFLYSGATASLDVSFGACPDLVLGLAEPLLLAAPAADANGAASYSSFVPTALAGVDLFFQAVAFDPLAPELGCGLSNLVPWSYR